MLAWWLWAVAAHAQVVDRLVAVVGGATVVTASDVELEVALAPLDASELPFWRHGDAAERLVDAALLRTAAADIALYQPTADAIRARTDAIHARFASDADWTRFRNRWGLDDAALAVVVRRRMVVERFLQRNLKADPAAEEAWLGEAHALLAGLEGRIPVRRITGESP
jgi:hypothetical protein